MRASCPARNAPGRRRERESWSATRFVLNAVPPGRGDCWHSRASAGCCGGGDWSGCTHAAGGGLLARPVAGRGECHGRRRARRPGAHAAAAVLGPRQRRRSLYGLLIRPRCPPCRGAAPRGLTCILGVSAGIGSRPPAQADSRTSNRTRRCCCSCHKRFCLHHKRLCLQAHQVCSVHAERCEMAASLSAEELGESFAIQSYGNLAARHALHQRADLVGCALMRIAALARQLQTFPCCSHLCSARACVWGRALGQAPPCFCNLFLCSLRRRRCNAADNSQSALASGLAGRRSVPSTATGVRADPGADGSGWLWAGPIGWHCVRPAVHGDTSACAPACSRCR